jgi:hypothetical protein
MAITTFDGTSKSILPSSIRLRSARLPLFDQQQHLYVLDPDWKRPYVFRDGLEDRLSRSDVKSALMQGALDFRSFEEAVAKAGVAMGTKVRGRVDFATDTVKGDVMASDINRDDVAFGHVSLRRNRQPFSTHSCLRFVWSVKC